MFAFIFVGFFLHGWDTFFAYIRSIGVCRFFMLLYLRDLDFPECVRLVVFSGVLLSLPSALV